MTALLPKKHEWEAYGKQGRVFLRMRARSPANAFNSGRLAALRQAADPPRSAATVHSERILFQDEGAGALIDGRAGASWLRVNFSANSLIGSVKIFWGKFVTKAG